jgi:hypothetical protein
MLLAFALARTTPDAARGQQVVYSEKIYQDFRGKKPLLDELKMIGPDREKVARFEEEGLRITLPKTRKSNQPVGVRLKFELAGDFEITATCEILAAERPPPNGAVGAALNLVARSDYKNFAKLGRFMLPEGDFYVAECRLAGKSSLVKTMKTDAIKGQYRLIREGTKLRYLVADEPENEFRTILETQFTDEDLEIVRLGVNNNGSPAGVDARLLDLRIRHGEVLAKSGPGPVVKPDTHAKPAPEDKSIPDAEARPSRGWLTAILLVGLGLAVLLAFAIAGFIFLRSRNAAPTEPAATFACPECGKTLKVKPELAGKKVKCSGCGKLVVMPGAKGHPEPD